MPGKMCVGDFALNLVRLINTNKLEESGDYPNAAGYIIWLLVTLYLFALAA